MMSHDFQFDDLGTFSDTRYCILLHMPMHDSQPSVPDAVVKHHFHAGLDPAVLCRVYSPPP